MRRAILICTILTLATGCFNRSETIDVAGIPKSEKFDWNGKITIQETYRGLLDNYEVERVTLHGTEGRKLHIFTEQNDIWAAIQVPDEKPNTTSAPATSSVGCLPLKQVDSSTDQ